MTTQPEAMLLSAQLEEEGWHYAAAELRRLHEENELLHKRCQQAYEVGRQSAQDDMEPLLRLREAHEWQKKLSEEGLRQIENLESLLRQVLDFCEFVWRDVAMNDHDAFERLEQIITAVRQHLEGEV